MKKLFLSACTLALAAFSTPASAQSKGTVYFLSWGGTVQETLEKEGWNKKFAEATGYNVVLVPKATGPEIIATAIAQKDKPQVDVVQTDLLPFLQGDDQGIFAPLSEKDVPNLALYPAQARVRANGVITYGDVFSILYNEELFKKKGWAPPKDQWSELLRPEFAGSMVLPPMNTTYGSYVLIILSRLAGGSEHNVEPGFAAMKKLAPGIVEWPTTFARMGQFLQDESAGVGFYTAATSAELRRRGIPVAHVVPKPVVFTGSAAGIMKNAPNPEGAKAFLNWFLSTPYMTHRLNRYGSIPMNTEVKGAPISPDDLAKAESIDFDAVNKQRPAWIARFDREILGK